ncbi:DUF58 domain-containing protein [Methanofollis fontis]|uniref:DUF58 domain-containing protein n=1 Tax=Methanofollis fontis TaxID=2052832 RepID=UPI001F1E44DC|nr:DUF58 domain-containing protein [Methanofollis fontis]
MDATTERLDLIRQVARIDVATRLLVSGLYAGAHGSVFRGRGIEFSEIREYVPGDDVRAIDWKVTARFGRPYIKEFSEDRDATFYILADLSASNTFGSATSKHRRILEVAAALIFAARNAGDSAGLLTFTDRVEGFIPARKGRGHAVALIDTLIRNDSRGRGTDLNVPLRFLARRVRRRASVFVVSDFATPSFSDTLRLLCGRHEVTAIRVIDPRERHLPDVGLIELEDPESGEQVLVDTSDEVLRSAYADAVAAWEGDLAAVFRRARVPSVCLTTEEGCETALRRLFAPRKVGVC